MLKRILAVVSIVLAGAGQPAAAEFVLELYPVSYFDSGLDGLEGQSTLTGERRRLDDGNANGYTAYIGGDRVFGTKRFSITGLASSHENNDFKMLAGGVDLSLDFQLNELVSLGGHVSLFHLWPRVKGDWADVNDGDGYALGLNFNVGRDVWNVRLRAGTFGMQESTKVEGQNAHDVSRDRLDWSGMIYELGLMIRL